MPWQHATFVFIRRLARNGQDCSPGSRRDVHSWCPECRLLKPGLIRQPAAPLEHQDTISIG
jgi:hypothetical protein